MKYKIFILISLMIYISIGCAVDPKQNTTRPTLDNGQYPQFVTQSTSPQNLQQITSSTKDISLVLNDAIDNALKNIKPNSIIAIADIVAPNQTVFNFLTFELEHTLVSKNFTVVDRSEINRIRTELEFQGSGEVDDYTAVRIGKFAGADVIVAARAETERINLWSN